MIFYSDDSEAREDFVSEEDFKRGEREDWLAEREAMERAWDEDDIAPDPPHWDNSLIMLEDEIEGGQARPAVPLFGIKHNNGLPVVFEISKDEPRFTRFLTEKAAQIYLDARDAGLSHWEAVWKAKEG